MLVTSISDVKTFGPAGFVYGVAISRTPPLADVWFDAAAGSGGSAAAVQPHDSFSWHPNEAHGNMAWTRAPRLGSSRSGARS